MVVFKLLSKKTITVFGIYNYNYYFYYEGYTMKKLIALALIATALVQTNSYALFGRGYGWGGNCCPQTYATTYTVCCPEVVTTTYCC